MIERQKGRRAQTFPFLVLPPPPLRGGGGRTGWLGEKGIRLVPRLAFNHRSIGTRPNGGETKATSRPLPAHRLARWFAAIGRYATAAAALFASRRSPTTELASIRR